MTNSSRTARKHQPETMVSGVALLDYDNDGWLDVYAVNGATMPSLDKTGPEYWNRLFRNNGDGTFTDVTERPGVAGRGYDLGVVTGDYDNDGDADLFVAGLRRNTLFRNNGDGTFTDVTERRGPRAARSEVRHALGRRRGVPRLRPRRPAGPVRLELLRVGPGARAALRQPRRARLLPSEAVPGPAELALPQQRRRDLHRRVRRPRGSAPTSARGWASASPTSTTTAGSDLFVSNDTVPSFLFMNNRNGTFAESAFERGRGASPSAPRPSPAWAPTPATSTTTAGPTSSRPPSRTRPSPSSRTSAARCSRTITGRSGVATHSRPRAGWGNGIVDLNNDGWKDLFVACADVMDPSGAFREHVPMANAVLRQPAGTARFADGSAGGRRGLRPQGRPPRRRLRRHRQRRPRRRRRHRARRPPRAVAQRLAGAATTGWSSGPWGRRATATAWAPRSRSSPPSGAQYDHVNTAVGYGCASDRRVHFGLGSETTVVSELTITWPSGKTQTLKQVRGRPGPDGARARARRGAPRQPCGLSLICRKTSNCCWACSVRPSFV